MTHYRGVFLADYANRPDAAASWRFLRADAGSGALGDLMAHVVDMTHFLVGPIDRVSGRTATMIARRPRLPGRRGHPLQQGGDGRPRRRRERGLGRRAVRVRRRHGRLARGQPRHRRAARADALRGLRHARRAGLGARAHERARAVAPSCRRRRRGLHHRPRRARPRRLRRLPAGRRRPDGLRRPARDRGRRPPGRDPRRRAARARSRGHARDRPRARGDRALLGQRRWEAAR